MTERSNCTENENENEKSEESSGISDADSVQSDSEVQKAV
jgi:hypothetical protein